MFADVNLLSQNTSAGLESGKHRNCSLHIAEGVTTMEKQLGLLTLAAVMGLGLTPSGFGQGPPAGAGSAQSPGVPSVGPAGGGRGGRQGRGFNCPFRRAALVGKTAAATLEAGRGMGMRRNAVLALGARPYCPFRSNAAVASSTAGATTSNNPPAFGPGSGIRRNARVAPGTGPFCPFNPNNRAATNNATATAARTGTASGSSQPITK